jgi:hypothetical protein
MKIVNSYSLNFLSFNAIRWDYMWRCQLRDRSQNLLRRRAIPPTGQMLFRQPPKGSTCLGMGKFSSSGVLLVRDKSQGSDKRSTHQQLLFIALCTHSTLRCSVKLLLVELCSHAHFTLWTGEPRLTNVKYHKFSSVLWSSYLLSGAPILSYALLSIYLRRGRAYILQILLMAHTID